MPSFLAGILRNDAGSIVQKATDPLFFVNGFGVTEAGELCVDLVGAIASHHNGIPRTAAGRIATEAVATGKPSFTGGWPVDPNGRAMFVVSAPDFFSNSLPYIGDDIAVIDAA